MMGGGLLVTVLLIGALAYAMGWRPDFLEGARPPEQPRRDALDIAKERYARGEIDRDEYQRIRRDLEG